MNKTKKIIQKLLPVAFILAMAVLIAPMEASAAKKPGAVSNIEETKVTDTSITLKFKKASGAKSYQIRVYEAKSKADFKTSYVMVNGSKRTVRSYNIIYSAKNKVLQTATTKKTTATIKKLTANRTYAIKIRAYNGSKYGKWATQYIRTQGNEDDTTRYPGRSTATGNNLKKQYLAWRAEEVKSINSVESKVGFNNMAFRCTKSEWMAVADANQYTMEEVYETYKRGYGSNLEIFHVALDAYKAAGVKAVIKKLYNEYLDTWSYALVVYSGKYHTDGVYAGLPIAETISIGTGSIVSMPWYEDKRTEDGWI